MKFLKIVQVERSIPETQSIQWMGRKVREREAIAGAFVP